MSSGIFTIIGLGNPGEEYKKTRHNAGMIALEVILRKNKLPEWHEDKKSVALLSVGVISRKKVILAAPQTFMNRSGQTAAALVKGKAAAERLIVIHDDLDLPLGKMKISFNRGSGGHRGLESIIKALKTEAFTRIRIGISPARAGGKVKKPEGEKAVGDFIIDQLKPAEEKELKKVVAKIPEAVATIVSESREKAMSLFN